MDNVLNLIKHYIEKGTSSTLDYTIDMFKDVYSTLKKNDPQTVFFAKYYGKVTDLLKNLNNTSLNLTQFYKKRIQFYNVISLIWVQMGSHHTISYTNKNT